MSLLSTALGGSTTIKLAAVAVGIAFAAGNLTGGTAGYKLRDITADLAEARLSTFIATDKAERAEAAAAILRKAVAARDEAAKEDAARANEQAAELTRQQEINRELEKRIKDGDCLDGDDADWLRNNWIIPDFKRTPAVPAGPR